MAYVVQAIVTKFISPTYTQGSRIKATASAGSVMLQWDHSLNVERNHAKAAKALADKFEWSGVWFQGGMPDDSGYVFVSGERSSSMGGVSDPAFTTEGKH